jgi:hypothetical protein
MGRWMSRRSIQIHTVRAHRIQDDQQDVGRTGRRNRARRQTASAFVALLAPDHCRGQGGERKQGDRGAATERLHLVRPLARKATQLSGHSRGQQRRRPGEHAAGTDHHRNAADKAHRANRQRQENAFRQPADHQCQYRPGQHDEQQRIGHGAEPHEVRVQKEPIVTQTSQDALDRDHAPPGGESEPEAQPPNV